MKQTTITTTATEVQAKELTAEELKALEVKEAELKEYRDAERKNFDKAQTNVEGSAWHLARTIYSAIHNPKFEEAFGSVESYSKYVGASRSYCSRLENVYARKLAIGQKDGEGAQFTTSQLAEMVSIELDDTMKFFDAEEVTAKDSVKTIRAKVKHYKNSGNESESESEGEGESSQEEDNSLVVTYKGEAMQIMNEEQRKAILAILGITEDEEVEE